MSSPVERACDMATFLFIRRHELVGRVSEIQARALAAGVLVVVPVSDASARAIVKAFRVVDEERELQR